MKTFIVSDSHIKKNKGETYVLFCKFLEKCFREKVDSIILLGDIFDFIYYDAREDYFVEFYQALEKLKLQGTKIYYLFGNHDFNFNFKKYSFIEASPFLNNFKIDFYNSFIFHGDGIDYRDYKYRILKKILRSHLFFFLYKFTPKKIIYYLSQKASSLSRKTSKKFFYSSDSRKSTYLEEAKKIFHKNKDLDLIIFAHTHEATSSSFVINGKIRFYINSGSFKYGNSYISIIDGFLKIEKFD